MLPAYFQLPWRGVDLEYLRNAFLALPIFLAALCASLAVAAETLPQYGYSGREPDGSGLVYYRARYYDVRTGRFGQRDPLGLVAGFNDYAYAGDPVDRSDPYGLASRFNLVPLLEEKRRANISRYRDPAVNLLISHGTPRGPVFNGELLPVAVVERLFKADPQYEPGKPVRLIACDIGLVDYCQALANQLQNTVQCYPVEVDVGDLFTGRDWLFRATYRFGVYYPAYGVSAVPVAFTPKGQPVAPAKGIEQTYNDWLLREVGRFLSAAPDQVDAGPSSIHTPAPRVGRPPY